MPDTVEEEIRGCLEGHLWNALDHQAGATPTENPAIFPGSAVIPATATLVEAIVALDGAVSQSQVKVNARVKTTANVNLATALANGQTVDGVVLATGDRVFVASQAAGAANGVYVSPASGAASRAPDFDASAEARPNTIVLVSEGTAYADTAWWLTTNAPITIGVTSLVFAQFGTAGSTPTGTGFRHATVGVEDAATKLVDTADINADQVTFPKIQNIPTDSLIGRDTAGTGDPEVVLLNVTLGMDGAGNLRREALSGDVTAPTGSNTTTIAAAVVTNPKLANMAQDTIKGRVVASTGDPQDLTPAEAREVMSLAPTPLVAAIAVNTGTSASSNSEDTIASTLIPAGAINKVLTKCIAEYAGLFGTDSTPPTLRIRWKCGGTTVLDSTALTQTGSLSAKGWHLRVMMRTETTGAAGTTSKVFGILSETTINASGVGRVLMLDGASLTLDMTNNITCDLTAQWGTNHAGNTITCYTDDILTHQLAP